MLCIPWVMIEFLLHSEAVILAYVGELARLLGQLWMSPPISASPNIPGGKSINLDCNTGTCLLKFVPP